MKPIIPFALLGALFAVGAAQAASTTPVGYNTVSLSNGFNFVGLTLHNPVVASGDLETIAAGSVTDTDIDFGTVLTSGDSYILEIKTALGISEVVTTWSGNSITTATDLSGDVAAGAQYSLRKTATLESAFGATADELAHGSFGEVGADQIWVFNGTGYNKYYYDDLSPNGLGASWVQFAPTSQDVDGGDVALPYAEGFLIVSATTSPKNVVITGEVKLSETEVNLVSGFNFVSSVAPAGATLASAFGATADGLVHGSFGEVGADQIWVFNGTGYNKYYYDDLSPNGLGASWVQFAPTGQDIADPSTIDLPSSYLIVSASSHDVTQGVPDSYSSL